jgi:hypothetical protein
MSMLDIIGWLGVIIGWLGIIVAAVAFGAAWGVHGSHRIIEYLLLTIVAALVGSLVLLVSCALARDDGRHANADPAVKAWVEGLHNGDGVSCCASADGWAPEEVEWDTAGARYRVRVDGGWLDVPDKALIAGPNRLGHAVVWLYRGQSGEPLVRCFLPGGGV